VSGELPIKLLSIELSNLAAGRVRATREPPVVGQLR